MALTLVASPGNTDLSQNQITAGITTNRHILQNATFANIVLDVANTNAAIGQLITFIVAAQAYPFTFATGLSDTGDIVRTAGALTLPQFIAQVAGDFASDRFIHTNYVITYTTTRITLTARKPGAAWNITATMNATGFSISSITTAVDYVVQDNHFINLDLWVENTLNSNSFTLLSTLAQQPTIASNRVDFSLEDFLHAMFNQSDTPAFNQNTITLCSHNRRRYYFTYYESFGTPPAVLRNYISATHTVFRGGTTRQEAAIFQNVITSWVHQTEQFLTWKPNNSVVQTYAYEYLYYCAPVTVTTFRVRFQVFFSDNTTSTHTFATRSNVNQFDTFIIPAGYTQLNIAAIDPTRTVVRYEVFLDDGTPANEISLRRGFDLDYTQPLGFVQFIFSNPLSAMDVLTCTGNVVEQIKTEMITTNRPYQRTTVLDTGEQFQVSPEKANPIKVNTGPLTAAQTTWLESFLLAEYKFVIDPVMQQHVPIIITPGSFVKTDLLQDVFAIEFEYTPAFFDHSGEGGIRQTLQSGN
jgi:hypothetical protein